MAQSVAFMITGSIKPFKDLLFLTPEFHFEGLFEEESLPGLTMLTEIFQPRKKIKQNKETISHVVI